MASETSVNILEVTRVTPSLHSPKSSTECSLPLTFSDFHWLKFHPVDRVFFYELTDLTPTFFNSTLVPKLKRSLSLTLLHFLPFAGNITWPDDQRIIKPFILYTPNDGVSVTVAESNADFTDISGNQIREVVKSSLYVPELPVSDSKAATIAFQITLFPNQGFSIGVSSHHAVFDGKSVTVFIRAWASICKQIQDHQHHQNTDSYSLPEELTPFLDRTVFQDPYGLDMIYLKNWSEAKLPGLNLNNPRSLKLFQLKDSIENSFRATFVLNLEDIKKLRRKIVSELDNPDNYFSRFVISYSYASVCLIKAIKPEKKTRVILVFTADIRARLSPPIPANYFGNCVRSYPMYTEAEPILAQNGVSFVAEKLSERIKRLETEPPVIYEEAKDQLGRYIKVMEQMASGDEKQDVTGEPKVIAIGTAGSTNFQVYGAEFGQGKPKKVEVSSLENGSISMAESGDGNGGVEIGLVLENKDELEKFDFLFVNGLKNL
ncbi:malonyl-CoA:anthocyanidin 5-O-glucoside-6''-O-malonyltransferase-like [Mercurialis annua]|uniref:malonyl-CoA:anthocyanidin 5-O-glucoside-6''-O-malonyltransferase-like n=1 Tax=Mercurialis annua TaxID=3986 RepID=UPI00215DEF06|nr:malonyl-CoA:anthocyanidin 5-O-glucoside-6''-O-malonyltransferase-like [Mercurialis annua]